MRGRALFPPSSVEFERAKGVSISTLAGKSQGTCPLCEAGRFEVNEKNQWQCSECGDNRWHTPIGYAMRRDSVDRDTAVRWLASMPAQPERLLPVIFNRIRRVATRLIRGANFFNDTTILP